MFEQIRMPAIPREPWRFYAETVFERIRSHLSDAVRDLKDDEAVMVSVPLRDGTRTIVASFGYRNPNFIIVDGVDEQKNPVSVLLSHTDVQLIFQVVKKDTSQPRKPIGFVVPGGESGNK